MRWQGREESSNVDDRRRFGGKTMAAGGVGGIVILLVAYFLGIDPQQLANLPGIQQEAEVQPTDPAQEKMASFSKVIFRDTEVVWDEQFRGVGKRYEKPVLVLFNGVVESACGSADSAVGPFYCPGDSRVYIDLAFYRDMERKLQAPGEFARAYVIAHEVGHHVQRLLGYSRRVDEARLKGRGSELNRMTVRLELQADFLAGVWAHHGQKKFQFLEPGDMETALNAAFQIGDDRLQKRSRGQVVPDSFTHGTSKQRMHWFQQGYETGKVADARLLFDVPYEEL